MSELMLLIARRRRWPQVCGKLVQECRLHYRLGLFPPYNTAENSGKLSYPIPFETRTIFRHLTRWNTIRIGLPSVLASTESRLACRAASSSPQQKDPVAEGSEICTPSDFDKTRYELLAEASILLQELCGFDVKEADELVNEHRAFSTINARDIRRNYEILIENGFSGEAIRKNSEILSMPVDILSSKITSLHLMNWENIDDIIPLLRLNTILLRRFACIIKSEMMNYDGNNRISIVAKKLQSPVVLVSQVMAKYRFLQTMPLAKLEQVLDMMLDAHVSPEDILNDIWALRYNINIIRTKLERVTDAGVFPVKPWMIRCPEETLARRISKEVRRRSVLGESGTAVDYLSERLQCNGKELAEKYPKILQLSGPKMKAVIDFLIGEGYTVDEIRRVPKILFHSINTMIDRLDKLSKYDHKPVSLVPLCKSKEQFEVYLQMVQTRWLKSWILSN